MVEKVRCWIAIDLREASRKDHWRCRLQRCLRRRKVKLMAEGRLVLLIVRGWFPNPSGPVCIALREMISIYTTAVDSRNEYNAKEGMR